MASKFNNHGCTGPYTWRKVKSDVQYLYKQKRSLRGVAAIYGKPITHGDIQRILLGIEPRDPRKRKALNLSDLVPAPACAKCGMVHLSKRCTAKAQARRYRDLWDLPVRALRKMMEERR